MGRELIIKSCWLGLRFTDDNGTPCHFKTLPDLSLPTVSTRVMLLKTSYIVLLSCAKESMLAPPHNPPPPLLLEAYPQCNAHFGFRLLLGLFVHSVYMCPNEGNDRHAKISASHIHHVEFRGGPGRCTALRRLCAAR